MNTLSTIDPNAVDISDQKESTFDNILEYFDSYILPFYPYKDSPVYKAVISFFIKYYIEILYNDQPAQFKLLYEEQVMSKELIDFLLVSAGLPENLISELTVTSKFIIMKSFADFIRYKGTIKFFRSVGGSFNDRISYYELYIDYDGTYINPVGRYLITLEDRKIKNGKYFLISSTENDYYVWFNIDNGSVDPKIENKHGIEIKLIKDCSIADVAAKIILELNETREFYVNVNGQDIIDVQLSHSGNAILFDPGNSELNFNVINYPKDNGAWILRPKPVYIHPKMEKTEDVFKYSDAYNKIPTLLVSEDQLENLKQTDDIILPTKSNIILLDFTSTTDGSYLNTLFFSIIMEHIGADLFSVFFSGSSGTTTMSYKNAIFMWYYLVSKYYNKTLEEVKLASHIVMGTGVTTDYILEDIPVIEADYDRITNREELYDFYNRYISDRFSQIFGNIKPTLQSMSETFERADYDMYNYVTSRLNSAENLKIEIQLLLDELYASIVLSFDRYKNNPVLSKYLPVILQFLTQVTTDIRGTDSYKLVYNLKPFHTEILDIARNKIEVDDKFNSLLLDDKDYSLFLLSLAEILNISSTAIYKFSPKKDSTSLAIGSFPFYNYLLNKDDILKVKDKIFQMFDYFLVSMMRLTDSPDYNISPYKDSTAIGFYDSQYYNTIAAGKSEYLFDDDKTHDFQYPVTTENIPEDIKFDHFELNCGSRHSKDDYYRFAGTYVRYSDRWMDALFKNCIYNLKNLKSTNIIKDESSFKIDPTSKLTQIGFISTGDINLSNLKLVHEETNNKKRNKQHTIINLIKDSFNVNLIKKGETDINEKL